MSDIQPLGGLSGASCGVKLPVQDVTVSLTACGLCFWALILLLCLLEQFEVPALASAGYVTDKERPLD